MTFLSTLPALFAAAHGQECSGPNRCFFCGAPCGETHSTGEYLKDTFTAVDSVSCPGSAWVCVGCVLCLREQADIVYHDGESIRMERAAMRLHSWVITERAATPANKKHLDWLRAQCLQPPAPPFAISLTDSGQKQLLYRGVVNHAADYCSVTLEGLRIDYAPDELHERLDLCKRIAAACGKPALDGELSPWQWCALQERFGGDAQTSIETWQRVRQEPLSRLAAWLTPKKEICERDYPAPAVAAG